MPTKQKQEEQIQYTEPGDEILDELVRSAGTVPKLDGLVIGTLMGWSGDKQIPYLRFQVKC